MSPFFGHSGEVEGEVSSEVDRLLVDSLRGRIDAWKQAGGSHWMGWVSERLLFVELGLLVLICFGKHFSAHRHMNKLCQTDIVSPNLWGFSPWRLVQLGWFEAFDLSPAWALARQPSNKNGQMVAGNIKVERRSRILLSPSSNWWWQWWQTIANLLNWQNLRDCSTHTNRHEIEWRCAT